MLKRSFSNVKNYGFTIVELLIVIVVIGILAAITIVSYTGISNRAKTARAQSNANAVSKVVHVYNVDPTKNALPSNITDITGYTNGAAKIPANVSVVAGSLDVLKSSTAETTVAYQRTAAGTGACIGYYDIANSAAKYIFVGAASSANLNIAVPTCS